MIVQIKLRSKMSQKYKPTGAVVKRTAKKCFSSSWTARAGISLRHKAVGGAGQQTAITAGLTMSLHSSDSFMYSLFPGAPSTFSCLAVAVSTVYGSCHFQGCFTSNVSSCHFLQGLSIVCLKLVSLHNSFHSNFSHSGTL